MRLLSRSMMNALRPLRWTPVLAALTILAGCQLIPTPPPTAVPPVVHARFTANSYRELPGWNVDRVQAVWPALLVGCKALVARPRTQVLWQAPCALTASVNVDDAAAIREFFESNFTPYRVSTSEGADSGLVTGYYEPLLSGSRLTGPAFPAPLYAPPEDLLIVELSELYPELKGKRVRGRLDGRRVIP
jgi:membrane-bound lytic murein transglycosylase A